MRSTLLLRGFCACTITLVPFTASIAKCQTASTGQQPQPVSKSSDILGSAISQVGTTISSLSISRWKAPGDVKSATQQNTDSIDRDIHNTLPALLTEADAAPASVSAVFPVYRNIDALYDVLLRVSETANLAASPNEAASIDSALHQLESARKNLGDTILANAKNHEAEMVKMRATIAQYAAAAQPPAPAKPTVVNDGPKPSTATKKKKKPAPATDKPATQTAPAQPQ